VGDGKHRGQKTGRYLDTHVMRERVRGYKLIILTQRIVGDERSVRRVQLNVMRDRNARTFAEDLISARLRITASAYAYAVLVKKTQQDM
jgi:hypothetical protein